VNKWRFVGQCHSPRGPVPDSEVVSIYGVNPWRHGSIALSQQIVVLDPREQSRGRWLRVHQILVDGLQLQYASGLITGDHWVFYVPADPDEKAAVTALAAKLEGHWRTSKDASSELPWPAADMGWSGREEFLKALDKVERKAERLAYRGFSFCRLCKCGNGYEGLHFYEWEWPAGFRHCVADHQVRPSKAFEDMVLNDVHDNPLR
jgi:hypothetical protein